MSSAPHATAAAGPAGRCHGPYRSERQAIAAARHIYAAAPGVPLDAGNRQLLEDACAAARVTLGEWDQAIIGWLSRWEPATCAVIAGLISRAAGLSPPRPGPAAKEAPDGPRRRS